MQKKADTDIISFLCLVITPINKWPVSLLDGLRYLFMYVPFLHSSLVIFSLCGAASISLHQCPLTIQEEAPPPQWLTPISCVGWVTDAERSFDIVPVSQSFVRYHFSLLDPFTHQCSNSFSLLPTVNESEWLLCFAIMISNMNYCVFYLQLYSKDWLESTGTSKEKTSGVVTVRVVRKEGWCTAGEIDSYLDENEAWCLWGERRAALASKWIEVSQKWSLNESPTIKCIKKFTKPMTISLLLRKLSFDTGKLCGSVENTAATRIIVWCYLKQPYIPR